VDLRLIGRRIEWVVSGAGDVANFQHLISNPNMENALLSETFASPSLREIRQKAEYISSTVAAPKAQEVDELSAWPTHTMDALGAARLLRLHVPQRLGGLG
jgi:alkylation response protein AidB-like acyl-CoA dehydrogenase